MENNLGVNIFDYFNENLSSGEHIELVEKYKQVEFKKGCTVLREDFCIASMACEYGNLR